IGATFFKIMAGQTTAVLQDTEVWLMDEIREAPLFAAYRKRREVDDPPFARDSVNTVAFCACTLGVLPGERIEDRRRWACIALWRLEAGQNEPRIDELVLVACGSVGDRVILAVPAPIFSPAFRIDVAFDADHLHNLSLRLCCCGLRGRRRGSVR